MAIAPKSQENFWALIKIEGGPKVTQKKYTAFKKQLQKSLRSKFGNQGKIVFKKVIHKKTRVSPKRITRRG
jgi:hypothetical protein